MQGYDKTLVANVDIDQVPVWLDTVSISFNNNLSFNIKMKLYDISELASIISGEVKVVLRKVEKLTDALTFDTLFALFVKYHDKSKLSILYTEQELYKVFYKAFLIEYPNTERYVDMYVKHTKQVLSKKINFNSYNNIIATGSSLEKLEVFQDILNKGIPVVKELKYDLPWSSSITVVERFNVNYKSLPYRTNAILVGSVEDYMNINNQLLIDKFRRSVNTSKKLRGIVWQESKHDDLKWVKSRYGNEFESSYNPVRMSWLVSKDASLNHRFKDVLEDIMYRTRIPAESLKIVNKDTLSIDVIVDADKQHIDKNDIVVSCSKKFAMSNVIMLLKDKYAKERAIKLSEAHDTPYITEDIRQKLCDDRFNIKQSIYEYSNATIQHKIVIDYRCSSELFKDIFNNLMRNTSLSVVSRSGEVESALIARQTILCNAICDIEDKILEIKPGIPMLNVAVAALEEELEPKLPNLDENSTIEEIQEYSRINSRLLSRSKDNKYRYITRLIDTEFDHTPQDIEAIITSVIGGIA